MTSQRIRTVLTPFDVAATQWFPAAVIAFVAESVSPRKLRQRTKSL
ncbi:hypothetical protein [Rhodococcus jostii]|nr:hypothetical protein [Rhodococcus jostii]